MTANLAAALQRRGPRGRRPRRDVYGYSIPRMLGVDGKPDVNAERKILPLDGPAGVKVMSIGFFVEENAAVVWRGPMLHKAIQQFLEDVDWGELDYLLLDLPPGTGDVSMTLAQLLPAGARSLIVTTPQPAAQTVARRAAEMAGKVDLELLGVIENMSGFTTPDGERFTIFGEGGGQLLADELDVPLLGKVPLSEELREHADAGDAARARRARTRRPRRRSARPPAGSSPRRPQELPVMQAEPPTAPAPRADRRHRAAGRPGPGLSALDERSRAQPRLVGRARPDPRRQRLLRRRAASGPAARLAAAVRARGGRRRRPASGSPHLQCHFGLDSLSWARRGASVVGLDFSEPAVAGRQRARGRDRARRQLRRRRRLRRRRGARRRALRRRLHRARGAQLAPRPAALGGRRRLAARGRRVPLPGRVPPVHLASSPTRT